MASLIKNRILKHLSRFTKNLSTDRINVSTLKGEGELTDLELNEDVLTDLLELPVWIRLTKAICNKVSCKIMWTKLKSVPIYLNLDEVLVEMETCEELRPHSTHTPVPNYSSGGKYGFSDKVIDGMTVRVNSIVVNFSSKAFHASFHLSRLCLDSRTPTWQKSDLRMTRLKEPESGELLIFKQVEWQTLRVEAKAVELQEEFYTPLRLITNQARCRITIKKRLSDCSILGSRLVFILDELLWVVTDSQLRAASHFANSLSDLIKRATQLSQKTKAARKLESSADWRNQASLSAPHPPRTHTTTVDNVLARVFGQYDVHETSYHFYSGRIDLHLCDEVTPDGVGSSHPLLLEGGAIQVTLENLSIDYYPYHLANGSRKYWLRYKENSTSRSSWVSSLLTDFRMRLIELLPGESPKHTPVHRVPGEPPKRSSTPTKSTINNYLARLMSVCVVVRIDEFTVYCVSTPITRSSAPSKCVASDKGRLMLPQDMSSLHLEWTQYYYPGDMNLPVPPPNTFIQLNPLHVTFDSPTLLWLNAFFLSLRRTMPEPPSTPAPKIDVRLEALMPRILFVDNMERPQNQADRPRKLQIQISRLNLTNSRVGDSCGRLDLGKCLECLQAGELFFCSGFPSKPCDPHPVQDVFVEHSLSSDRSLASGDQSKAREAEDIRELFNKIQKDLLWQEEKNIWCIHMDPVWADFTSPSFPNKPKSRPVPFLDALPLTLWIYQKPKNGMPGDIYALAHVQSLINIQVNHYQYLFFQRTLDSVSEMTKQLVTDTSQILGVAIAESPITCAAACIPEMDVTFVLNSTPETEGENEESIGNCGSITPDEANYRRQSVVNGVRESASEHADLKVPSDTDSVVEGNMAKSRSDSLLDSRSLANGSPSSSASKEMLVLPQEEIPHTERTPLTDLSDNLTRTLASGSSVMKKGFSSLRSSIDSALTSSKASLQSMDRKAMGNSPDDAQSMEDWETLSIRSDLSSDSDQFLMVHLDNQATKAEDALFRSTSIGVKVEKASEMKETPTSTSSCSVKRLDLVSTLTFRMGKVEVIQNSKGHDSVIRLLCRQLASEGQSNITWDEFQTKFSARSRGWQETQNGLNHHPCDVRIRYEIGPFAEKVATAAEERGVLTGIISGVSLSLLMGGVVGMPDLIEDEIIPLPMPLRIYLQDITISLQDDRPPVNVTSPGPVPIDLAISKLSIRREADGIFHIKRLEKDVEAIVTNLPSPLPVSQSSPVIKPLKRTATTNTDDVYESKDVVLLKEENEQLNIKLMVLHTLETENEKLKEMVAMETAKAASAMHRLEEVEEEVRHLQEEKKSLMATRRVLQQELLALETRHNSFSTHNATG